MSIDRLLSNRTNQVHQPGIKVNLYHGYEYEAMKDALNNQVDLVESVMVGDSYFMTHLGQASTTLTAAQREESLTLLPNLILEVRHAINQHADASHRPLLMADVPEGLSEEQTTVILDRFEENGADIVKFEVENTKDLSIARAISQRDMIPAIHLGYTPQHNDNKLYGISKEEITDLKASVLAAKSQGVRVVIFERLSEVANQILSEFSVSQGILPYSIFSGRAPFGGQSLNIWDSVVKPSKASIFFPPTSTILRSEVEEKYTTKNISIAFKNLFTLAVNNVFPPSPRNNLSIDTVLGMLGDKVI